MSANTPSEEEIERKRAERRQKKLDDIKDLKLDDGSESEGLGFLPRAFASISESTKRRRVRLLNWNVLAQSLVRRDLFPQSDCLKIKERIPTIAKEIMHYRPDIATLQEVDHLDKHNRVWSTAYAQHSFIGYPDKQHSLCILWDKLRLKRVNFLERRLDELAFASDPPRPDGQEPRRRLALSRVTRNVGLAVALELTDGTGGLIVATTHAHWHSAYTYERSRQLGLWMREVRRFRDELGKDWPIVLAGDLNSQPIDPAYRLLLGAPLTAAHRAQLSRSRIVHESVDKLAASQVAFPMPGAKPVVGQHEESNGGPHEDEEGDNDRVLKGCRQPKFEDGMLSDNELESLFVPMRSAYGSCADLPGQEHFCDRPEDQRPGDWKALGMLDDVDQAARQQRGDFEPLYTSVTPLWRCTLDYIMLDDSAMDVVGLLPTHRIETIDVGLPRAGIGSSDHIAVGAELAW